MFSLYNYAMSIFIRAWAVTATSSVPVFIYLNTKPRELRTIITVYIVYNVVF